VGLVLAAALVAGLAAAFVAGLAAAFAAGFVVSVAAGLAAGLDAFAIVCYFFKLRMVTCLIITHFLYYKVIMLKVNNN
jgi:uncharacterized membrane-anchored protein